VNVLGRKNYTTEELDHARTSLENQCKAYRALVEAITTKTPDEQVGAALASFEVPFFNNLVLALDCPFVHRIRMVTGKDTNALNEVELLCDSIMDNNGIFAGSTVIKYVPGQSVLGLEVGDPIRLTEPLFERLSSAFFTEIGSRFL
jgi:hypothetical protein